MAQPLKTPFPQATKLFHNNWLIFFLLKRQRNSQQMPQDGALHSQNGGKAVFSLYYEDETIITMTKSFWKVSVIYRCGCFISTVRWKIQPFFQFSPWRDPRLRHFSGYPFEISRNQTPTIFYNTAYWYNKTPTYYDRAKFQRNNS